MAAFWAGLLDSLVDFDGIGMAWMAERRHAIEASSLFGLFELWRLGLWLGSDWHEDWNDFMASGHCIGGGETGLKMD